MKNLIFLFLAFSFFAQAQDSTTPYRYVVGGSLSGSSNNFITPESESIIGTSTTINPRLSTQSHSAFFSPYFGWHLKNNSVLSLRLSTGFSLSKTFDEGRNLDTFRSSSFTIGGGFFYRHYINPANKFKIFVQPFVNGTVTNGQTMQAAPFLVEFRSFNFNAGAGLGTLLSISDKWNLLVNIWSISYNHNNSRSATEIKPRIDNSIIAGLSLSTVSFGAEYTF